MGFLDAFFAGDWQDRIDEVGLDQHAAETIGVYEPEPDEPEPETNLQLEAYLERQAALAKRTKAEPDEPEPETNLQLEAYLERQAALAKRTKAEPEPMSQAEKELLFYGTPEQQQHDIQRVSQMNEDLAKRAAGQVPARDISPIDDYVDMEYVHGVTMASGVAGDYVRNESDRQTNVIDGPPPFVVEDGSIRMISQLEDLARIEQNTKSSIENELERRSGVLGALFAQKNAVVDSLKDTVQTNAITANNDVTRIATTGIIDLGTVANQYADDLEDQAAVEHYIIKVSDMMDSVVDASTTSHDKIDATTFDMDRFFDVVSQENKKALADHLANTRVKGDEYVLRTSSVFGDIRSGIEEFAHNLDEVDVGMATRLADIVVERAAAPPTEMKYKEPIVVPTIEAPPTVAELSEKEIEQLRAAREQQLTDLGKTATSGKYIVEQKNYQVDPAGTKYYYDNKNDAIEAARALVDTDGYSVKITTTVPDERAWSGDRGKYYEANALIVFHETKGFATEDEANAWADANKNVVVTRPPVPYRPPGCEYDRYQISYDIVDKRRADRQFGTLEEAQSFVDEFNTTYGDHIPTGAARSGASILSKEITVCGIHGEKTPRDTPGQVQEAIEAGHDVTYQQKQDAAAEIGVSVQAYDKIQSETYDLKKAKYRKDAGISGLFSDRQFDDAVASGDVDRVISSQDSANVFYAAYGNVTGNELVGPVVPGAKYSVEQLPSDRLPTHDEIDWSQQGYKNLLSTLGVPPGAVQDDIARQMAESATVVNRPTVEEREKSKTLTEKFVDISGKYGGVTGKKLAQLTTSLYMTDDKAAVTDGMLDETVIRAPHKNILEKTLARVPGVGWGVTIGQYLTGPADEDSGRAKLDEMFQGDTKIYTITSEGERRFAELTTELKIPGATQGDIVPVGVSTSRGVIGTYLKYGSTDNLEEILRANPAFGNDASRDPVLSDAYDLGLDRVVEAKHGTDFETQATSVGAKGLAVYNKDRATVELTPEGEQWRETSLNDILTGKKIVVDFNQVEQSLLFTGNTDEQLQTLTSAEHGDFYEQIPEQYQGTIGKRDLTPSEKFERLAEYEGYLGRMTVGADGFTDIPAIDGVIAVAGLLPLGMYKAGAAGAKIGGKAVVGMLRVGDDVVDVGKFGVHMIDNLPTSAAGATAYGKALEPLSDIERTGEMIRAQSELGIDTVAYSIDTITDPALKKIARDTYDRTLLVGGKNADELGAMPPDKFSAHVGQYGEELADKPQYFTEKLGLTAEKTSEIQNIRSAEYQKAFENIYMKGLTPDQRTAFSKVFSGVPYTAEDGVLINAALYRDLDSPARNMYRETTKSTVIGENIRSIGREPTKVMVNLEMVEAGNVSPKSLYNVFLDNKNGAPTFGGHFNHVTKNPNKTKQIATETAEIRNLIDRAGDDVVGDVFQTLHAENVPNADVISKAYERAFGLGYKSHGDMTNMSPTDLAEHIETNVFELVDMFHNHPGMGVAWRDGFDASQLRIIDGAVIKKSTELQALKGVGELPVPEREIPLVGDLIPEVGITPPKKFVPFSAERTERLKKIAEELGVSRVPERPVPIVTETEAGIKVTVPEVFVPSKIVAEMEKVSGVGVLDPFKSRLDDMLDVDPAVSGRKMYDLLQKEGYAGSYSTLTEYVRGVRPLPKTADEVIEGADDVVQAAIVHAADDTQIDILKAQFFHDSTRGKTSFTEYKQATAVIDAQHASGDAVKITPGTTTGKPIAHLNESVETVPRVVGRSMDEMIEQGERHAAEVAEDISRYAEETRKAETGAGKAYADAAKKHYDEVAAKNADDDLAMRKAYDEYDDAVRSADSSRITAAETTVGDASKKAAVSRATEREAIHETGAMGGSAANGKVMLNRYDDSFAAIEKRLDSADLTAADREYLIGKYNDLGARGKRTPFGYKSSVGEQWEQALRHDDVKSYLKTMPPDEAMDYAELVLRRYGVSGSKQFNDAYVSAAIDRIKTANRPWWGKASKDTKYIVDQIDLHHGFPDNPKFWKVLETEWSRADMTGKQLFRELAWTSLVGVKAAIQELIRHPLKFARAHLKTSMVVTVLGGINIAPFALEELFQGAFLFTTFDANDEPERASEHLDKYIGKWNNMVDWWMSTGGRILEFDWGPANILFAAGKGFQYHLTEGSPAFLDNKVTLLASMGWWGSQADCPTETGYGRMLTTEERLAGWAVNPASLFKNPDTVIANAIGLDTGATFNPNDPDSWAGIVGCGVFGCGQEALAVLWGLAQGTSGVSSDDVKYGLGDDSAAWKAIEAINKDGETKTQKTWSVYNEIWEEKKSEYVVPTGPVLVTPAVVSVDAVTAKMISDVAASLGVSDAEAEEQIKNYLRSGAWQLVEQADGSYKLERIPVQVERLAGVVAPAGVGPRPGATAPSNSGGAHGGQFTAVEEQEYITKHRKETGVSVSSAFYSMGVEEQTIYRTAYMNSDGSVDVDAFVAANGGWC